MKTLLSQIGCQLLLVFASAVPGAIEKRSNNRIFLYLAIKTKPENMYRDPMHRVTVY